MADVRMDKARYIDPDGREQIVQASYQPLREGNVYYNKDLHKGHLKCLFCDAAVKHREGNAAICGSNFNGGRDHFCINAKQNHEDHCEWPESSQSQSHDSHYDDSRGYKIHLNVTGFMEQFNAESGRLYSRGADGKIIINDPDLKGRRPESVNSIEDIVRLIKRGDFDRLNKSVVVYHEHVLPWESFFIRYSRNSKGQHDRFVDLIERLEQKKSQPCLMEFNLKSGIWSQSGSSQAPCARSNAIFYGRDDGGHKHFILPRVYLDNYDVSHAMEEAGHYLVLGNARGRVVENAGSVAHFINISVTDRRQVVAANVNELAHRALERYKKSCKP